MKKVAIFLAAIALTTGVFAQVVPELDPTEWFNQQVTTHEPGWANDKTAESTTGIRRSRAPFTPATLLLLGLSGAVVGTRVIRNTKK